MKLIVAVALALVAVTSAAPPVQETAQIVRSHFEQNSDGFDSGFETSDGLLRSDIGSLKEVFDEEKKPHQVVVFRGQWSYISPDGKTESITYVADENGFQPQGDSIPKPSARR